MSKKAMHKKQASTAAFRDRIVELVRLPASSLVRNTKNWRTHPREQQEALAGILAEVGFVDVAIARRGPDGSVVLIDGHLRAETAGDSDIPVVILDVTEAEADKLLLTLDPLAAMAATNAAALDSLLRSCETGSEGLAAAWESLAEDAGLLPGEKGRIEPLEMRPPPEMAWVLVGLPVVRYGELQGAIDAIAAVDGVTLLTTCNDREPRKN